MNNTLPTEYEGGDYETFLRLMEKMRLARRTDCIIHEDDLLHSDLWLARHNIDPGRTETWFAWLLYGTRGKKIRFDPNDINLRAYIIARQYDPDKHTFGKILLELIKHKDQLHPYIRRYLIETMREAQNKHRRLADCYGSVADQFETVSELKEAPTEAA